MLGGWGLTAESTNHAGEEVAATADALRQPVLDHAVAAKHAGHTDGVAAE